MANQKIVLVRPAHVYYKHDDQEKAHQFLLDFGFAEESRVRDKISYRDYGPDPFVLCTEKSNSDSFGGAAFVVESYSDLEYASSTIPNASPIYPLIDAPGGGSCVTFPDPVDGFPFHLVHGQTLRSNASQPLEPSSDTTTLPNGNPKPSHSTTRTTNTAPPINFNASPKVPHQSTSSATSASALQISLPRSNSTRRALTSTPHN